MIDESVLKWIKASAVIGCIFLFLLTSTRRQIRNIIMLTVYPKKYAHGFCFAVLCCGYTLTDFPISMRLTSLATIAPVPAKQPWWVWINTSCGFIMNDCITTTKQSTTKPCAYFIGYTVHVGSPQLILVKEWDSLYDSTVPRQYAKCMHDDKLI